MAEPVARRVVARGRVQGVFFRDATQRVARQAGVRGWVRNEPDGTVQAHVEGEPSAVESVVKFLRVGPERARVDSVDVRDVAPEGDADFEVR